MDEEQVLQLVLETVSQEADDLDYDQLRVPTAETALFGGEAGVDSLVARPAGRRGRTRGGGSLREKHRPRGREGDVDAQQPVPHRWHASQPAAMSDFGAVDA